MRNQRGDVISNFQLKKSGKKYIVYLVVGANLKSSGESTVYTILSKKTTEGKTSTEQVRTITESKIKYSYLFVSTQIEGEPENWDKTRKRFIGNNPLNIQLDNIEFLSKEIIRKYLPSVRNAGFIQMPYLREAIEKLVFGKKTPEHKSILKDKRIIDSVAIQFDNGTKFTQKHYGQYPRVVGDSVKVMDKAIEVQEKDKRRNTLLSIHFYDYIETMRKHRYEAGELTYQSQKGYSNLSSFILAYEKECSIRFCIREINEKWAIDFMTFARKRKQKNGNSYSYNYINEILQKQLKATCNYLKAYDKIDLGIEWGIKTLKKSKEKTQEVALTIPQLKMILDLELNPGKDSKIELSREILTVMCLTGLRISDFKNLNLEEQQNGDYILNQITLKTKTQIRFLVHPKVVEIYKKYNGVIPTISEA